MTSEKPQIAPSVAVKIRDLFMAELSTEQQEVFSKLPEEEQLLAFEQMASALCVQEADLPTDDSAQLTEAEIKLLAKQPDVTSRVRQFHAQIVENVLGMIPGINDNSEPLMGIDEVRAFANLDLNNPKEMTAQQEDLLGVCKALPEPYDEYMQAIVATQQAGLLKPTQLLYRAMFEHMLVHGNQDLQQALEALTAQQALSQQAAKSGRKGGRAQDPKREEIKEYCLPLYRSGNFINPSQAADKLLPKMLKKAESIGCDFTSEYQARQWLYKLLWNDSKTN